MMKVCFISNNIYPFLSGTYVDERIGGAELQKVSIGQGLQKMGYEVTFITQDYGQAELEVIRGFNVYKTFKEDSGLPVVRFLYPRLAKMWKALRIANADVYYTRGAGFLPGLLALFCRIHKKKFVFAGASDTDFIPDKLLVRTLRDKLLYRYGLKQASAIVVQSERQKTLLRDNFHLKGEVIRNFLDEPCIINHGSHRDCILWVSTIREIKQPLHFLRLAEDFPSKTFVMIGGKDSFSPGLFEDLKQKARDIPNLKFLGFQPFHKTEEYFDQCKVFINTSIHEGFPNTFLQAWRRGLPVISYVDPDKIIQKNHLGWVVDSEEALNTALRNFLENEPPNPLNIMEYYEKNHSLKLIDNYCDLFEKLL